MKPLLFHPSILLLSALRTLLARGSQTVLGGLKKKKKKEIHFVLWSGERRGVYFLFNDLFSKPHD